MRLTWAAAPSLGLADMDLWKGMRFCSQNFPLLECWPGKSQCFCGSLFSFVL